MHAEHEPMRCWVCCAQLRLCCQFENTLDVNVLPPYVPSEEEKGNPGLYAKNVQALYAKALGVPIMDQACGPACSPCSCPARDSAFFVLARRHDMCKHAASAAEIPPSSAAWKEGQASHAARCAVLHSRA